MASAGGWSGTGEDSGLEVSDRKFPKWGFPSETFGKVRCGSV
jgi:hypothetical protein